MELRGNEPRSGEVVQRAARFSSDLLCKDNLTAEGNTMNEEQKEEVLSALEGAANFLRGCGF